MLNAKKQPALDEDRKKFPTPTAMIAKDAKDAEEWAATNELLDDPDFVADFEAAKKDVEEGNTFRWEDIKRDV